MGYKQNFIHLRQENSHLSNKNYRKSINGRLLKASCRYPVILREGNVLFGLFEVMFDQPAFYNYKACRIPEQTKASAEQRMVETFFIRKKNWQQIARDEKNFKIMKGFKFHAVMAYLKNIHIPISLAIQQDMGIIKNIT